MDPKFFEAWFNTEHTVLGRRLQPFSLQTALILALCESPFLVGVKPGVDYSMIDLQEAVIACSTPAEIFLNAKLTAGWVERFKRKVWTLRCARMSLREECQKFVTYIDDFNTQPEVWANDDGDGGQLGAPWVLCNAVFLLRNTTMSETRVWTMPLGMALWYAATIAEQMGTRIQIPTEDERAALEELGL